MQLGGISALLLTATAISVAVVLLLGRLAPLLGLVDAPGGRKSHSKSVPLVGGLAIFVSLIASALWAGLAASIAYLLLALERSARSTSSPRSRRGTAFPMLARRFRLNFERVSATCKLA